MRGRVPIKPVKKQGKGVKGEVVGGGSESKLRKGVGEGVKNEEDVVRRSIHRKKPTLRTLTTGEVKEGSTYRLGTSNKRLQEIGGGKRVPRDNIAENGLNILCLEPGEPDPDNQTNS